MLSVEGLKVSYGRIPVLHGLDFRVSRGETLGVLGHNGMGKTTLLKSLMGIMGVKEGAIIFDGEDVTRAPPYDRSRLGMGYVPQGRGIFPNLTVRENLRIACLARQVNDDLVVEEILEEFPRLKPILQRYGHVLSGGEQQILALARCLCGAPKLMLLDEPTEGIQPSIVSEIADVLKSLSKRRDLTIVLVEQKLDFIAALSQRVYVMQRGKLVKQVSPNQLSNSDIVREFVGMTM
jgi:branched-chain amino acid transport system ATP-binding protein